jgi:hypothetical protein
VGHRLWELWYTFRMTKRLEEVIAYVRELPEEEQDRVDGKELALESARKPAAGAIDDDVLSAATNGIEGRQLLDMAIDECGVGRQVGEYGWIEILNEAIVRLAQHESIVVVDVEDDLVSDVAEDGALELVINLRNELVGEHHLQSELPHLRQHRGKQGSAIGLELVGVQRARRGSRLRERRL